VSVIPRAPIWLSTGLVRGYVREVLVGQKPSGWRAGLRRRRARVQIAVATPSGNSLGQSGSGFPICRGDISMVLRLF